MGNTQASDKQSKTGKSPAKKHFIRNLNRKSQGRESKKHGRKKSDAKRDAIDREFDKTPDSDNVELIETSDNDTVECLSRAPQEGEGDPSVQSEVTVSRCGRSPTREPAAPPAASPQDESTSESVFTDPLTPLTAAVELNQCYYSAESDSAPDEALAPRTLTPSPAAPAPEPSSPAPAPWPDLGMPHEDATSVLNATFLDIEEKNDVFDDSADRSYNETVMGSIISGVRAEPGKRNSHECSHDFLDNRLKASHGQTSFTLSKHRKVELPPVGCEPSLSLLDNENELDRRHSSLSDVPMTESNVLRKVASLTLDKHSETRVVRPKYVPDKLDFRLYEKFEGRFSFCCKIYAAGDIFKFITWI